MKLIQLIIILCFSSLSVYGIEVLNTTEYVANDQIKSVQFYIDNNVDTDVIYPAITSTIHSSRLTLEFDLLGFDMPNYSATIKNCTWDWKLSQLSDMDYLEEYNEFRISDFEPSTNTKIPYTHYRFTLPKVSMSGNYILIVYNDDKPDVPVIVRRFCLYSSQGRISENNLTKFLTSRGSKQVLNFDVFYPKLSFNPTDVLKVIIRQNYRWDRYLADVPPSFINYAENKFQFNFVNEAYLFEGGNEFRKFDMRSMRFTGVNVASADFFGDTSKTYIEIQEDRSRQTYLSREDVNGAYVIGHYEYGNGDTEGDYFLTQFRLKTYPRVEPIYVFGALTDWKLLPQFEMNYDEDKKMYTCEALVKQGYYNYIFAAKDGNSINETLIEGSHFQTENAYEVFLYQKKPDQFHDALIGYKVFRLNDY